MGKKTAIGCGLVSSLGVAGTAALVLVLLVAGMVALVVVPPLGLRAHAAWQEQLSPREAHPRYGTYVRAHDVDLHVWRHGPEDGPVVLFVHGTSAWSGTWRDLVIDLGEAGYHCVAVDLPPFGFSERPVANAYSAEDQAKRILGVLDALEIEHATLIGHSFGGGATIEAALMARGRIDAMVLIDVALGIGQRSDPSPFVQWVLATPVARELGVAATFTNPWFTPIGVRALIADPADATPVVIDRYTEPFVVEGSTREIGRWLPELLAPPEPPRASNPKVYARLGMPTLVLWGEEDTATPLAQGEELARLLPRAKLVRLPGVGHIPQIEDREGVRKAVLTFLERRPKRH